MELKITNFSGDNILLFESDKLYDNKMLFKSIPNLSKTLNRINNFSWTDTFAENIDADKIKNLIMKIKNSFQPLLKFLSFVLVEDSYTLNNLWNLPKYIYVISIINSKQNKLDWKGKISNSLGNGISLNMNIIQADKDFSFKAENPEIITSVQLILGNVRNNFVCNDDICQENLGEFAKFIRGKLNNFWSNENPPQTINEGQQDGILVMHSFLDSNLGTNNTYSYLLDDGSSESYVAGTSDTIDSIPLVEIVLITGFVLFIIFAILFAIIWVISLLKKNNINVNSHFTMPSGESPESPVFI